MTDRNDDLTRRGANRSIEGKSDDLKGKVKDAAGGLTGDTSLQAEGKMDQAKGKIKDAVGKAEREMGKRDRRVD